MPTTLTKHNITTLKDFTDFVERLSTTGEAFWYRGCGQSSYTLVPSLYRHPEVREAEKLLELEADIISRFKQRSVPYLDRPITEDWDYLFFMQHSRVPTRLLDWTENPYIALYFALTSTHPKTGQNALEYLDDASVWVLNPEVWNQKVLQHIGYKRGILSPPAKELSGYAPSADIALMNSDPVAMYGTHNSPRIVAQRGVFIIFGKNLAPMEETYVNSEFPQDCLQKLVFPEANIPDLLKSLQSIGYADSVIFPDLDGLATEIKRFFGFLV